MNERSKILVVDDNPSNLLAIRTILKGIDAELREALNGFDALTMCLEEEFALILLDVQMPEMDGFEVCEQLRSDYRTADTPIIFLTAAYKEDEDKIKGFLSGATDYLAKPIEDIILKAKVEIFLRLYKQQKLLHQKNLELQEVIATKNKFFSIIAHDLKSPFLGFIGLTSALVEEEQNISLEERNRFIKLIHERAINLFKLLENLLEWSRLQNNTIEFKPDTIDFSKTIEEVIQNEISFANQKNIEIINYTPKNLFAYADIYMIKANLRNLISNAIKFTPIGGKIELFVEDNESEVLFSIKDSGIGMSKKMLDKLFRSDEKVARPGTQGESSTGLGLLLCKEFIDKHNGKIFAESIEGQGSSFYFSLPKQKTLKQ